MAILSKTTKPATPATLHGTRERVADLKAELAETRRAGLPIDQVEADLRRVLEQSRRNFDGLIDRAATAMAEGNDITLAALLDYQMRPEAIGQIALGGVVAALGESRIISQARERAAALDGPPLRLPSRERRAKIEDLTEAIYLAEVQEEVLREAAGEARRQDADALAVLGLPYSVCVDHGLLRGEA